MDVRNTIGRTAVTLFVCLIFGLLRTTGTVLRNDCKFDYSAVKFRAANVLEISWSPPTTRDVIGDENVTSAECLLRLYDITDDVTSARAEPAKVCAGRDLPVVERSVTSSDAKFQLWNETFAGVHYIVCLRQKDVEASVSLHYDESVWSTKYAHVPLHQPPVFKGPCTVLIRGVKAAARFIEAKRTYIYKQSDGIELYCKVTGEPSPLVHWCKDSKFCDNSTSISRSQTVTISDASKADAGTYILFAENKYGLVQSESLTFTLAEFAAETIPAQTSEYAEGVSLQLACHVTTSFPPSTVTWYRVQSRLDRKAKPVGSNNRIAYGADGTLVIVSLLPVDSDNYSCNAMNEELGKGQMSTSYYTILVKEADYPRDTSPVPLTKLNSQRKSSLIGTTVDLQCFFSGRPPPVISWFHNGLALAENGSRYSWSNHTLTIRRLSVADEGTYMCSALNSMGSATVDVHLTVFDLPTMTELPKSLNVSVGDTAVFRCNASGRPLPSISWYINNSLIPNSHSYYQPDSQISANDGRLMLHVDNTFESCSVRCNASNDHGYVTSSAYLNVYAHTRFTDVPQNVTIPLSKPEKGSPDARHILLPCGAITDLQTELNITWLVAVENTTYGVAIWQMTENRSLVVDFSEELIASNIWTLNGDLHCITATCVASNGLTSDSRSADICWTNSNAEYLASIKDLYLQVQAWWPLIAGIAGVLIVTLVVIVAVCTHHRRMLKKCGGHSNSTGSCTVMHVNSLSSNGRRLTTQFSVDSRTQIIPGHVTRSASTSDSVDCLVCENGMCMNVGPQALNHRLQLAIEGLLIEREQLQLGETIGKGQFGRVFSANLHRGSLSEHVAVKTMKFKADESDMVELFLKEAVIMKGFSNNNVLHIIGVSFECDGSPMVILPYMANGDLRQYILNPKLNITILELLKMGIQVANGMQYLSSLRFVHRDLAARNCMVNDRGVVKVADFGLSRQLLLRDYYRSDCSGTTPVPIRWLAPESLEASIFTTMGDVWSYGVLLWELMTRGAVPYADVENWQIATFVQQGGRLSQPIYCPDVIYDIMNKCWQENPTMRPSFEELVCYIEVVIQSAKPGCRSSSVFYQNITRERNYSASTSASVDHDQSATESHSCQAVPSD